MDRQREGGVGCLLLTAVHHLDHDLGEYRRLSVAVMARSGRRTGTYIHRLPVDDEFSRAAGVGIRGLPKTVEELSVTFRDGGVTAAWDGGAVLRLRVRHSRRLPLRDGAARRHPWSTPGPAEGGGVLDANAPAAGTLRRTMAVLMHASTRIGQGRS